MPLKLKAMGREKQEFTCKISNSFVFLAEMTEEEQLAYRDIRERAATPLKLL